MFNWEVCLLTLQKVGILFAYIAIGYGLRRCKALPENSDGALSKLVTLLFCPAYSIVILAESMQPEALSQNLNLLGMGTLVILASLGLALVLGKLLGRDLLEKRSVTYAMTITNYGYFGYPLVAGVFGQQMLSDMMVFTIPIILVTNSVGYLLFVQEKVSWKKLLLTPMLLALFVGTAIGLCGITLPVSVRDGLMMAGNCMSPVSMVLGGFVLGSLPIKELITGWRSYLYGALRLVLIPALFVAVLYVLGVRGVYLLISGAYLALPLGMNLVVFPASLGYDTRDNAKMCFVSLLLSVVTLPIVFSLLQSISQ